MTDKETDKDLTTQEKLALFLQGENCFFNNKDFREVYYLHEIKEYMDLPEIKRYDWAKGFRSADNLMIIEEKLNRIGQEMKDNKQKRNAYFRAAKVKLDKQGK